MAPIDREEFLSELSDRTGPDEPSPPSAPEDISPVQERIFELIQEEPGISIRSVADAIEKSYSTVRYHLGRLERWDLIETSRDGRTVRHFDAGCEQAIQRIAPLLREGTRTAVLEHVVEEDPGDLPYTSVNEIAEELDLDFRIVVRSLEHLDEAGYIDLRKVRGRYRIEPTCNLDELRNR